MILNVGTGEPKTGVFERAIAVGETNPRVYTSLGVHPHDARFYDDETEAKIKSLLSSGARTIAWGEIGLDFHYDNSPRDVQTAVFARQLQAAKDSKLPVIIHTREAETESIAILKAEYSDATRRGIFHCFSGSAELAKQAIQLGFMISFSGIVSFKTAHELRSIAKSVPAERLLIETDCPFLTPVPHRGKRNEPAYVIEVARCLAEVRNTSIEEIAEVTTNNFLRFFELSSN